MSLYLYALNTQLYGLYNRSSGDFLKWGITNSPKARYTLEFMKRKKMVIFGQGSRRDMSIAERWLESHNAGRLNRTPWSRNILNELGDL